MRSEKEMMDLIITTATQDERIRSVIMNGSRANPEIQKDCFQDYDIVYIVKDVSSFQQQPSWIDRFGKRLILQMPNSFPQDKVEELGLVYLMQFDDGNRIDLTICTQEQFHHRKDIDVIILDKDDIFTSSKKDPSIYHVKKPTHDEFIACCNEYWWINPYVAKGLWRKELSYAKWYMDINLREELIQMLSWYCGIEYDFQISVGKLGKYLKTYLPLELWQQFEKTYAGSNTEEIWTSLEHANTLFHTCAVHVASTLQLTYNNQEENNVRAYIAHIKQMKEDAQSIVL